MQIDYGTVTAIMAIFGVGLLGIIQTVKTLLKLQDIPAKILAFLCSGGATAVILVQTHAFNWLAFVLYTIIVYGEASGLYHIVPKKA